MNIDTHFKRLNVQDEDDEEEGCCSGHGHIHGGGDHGHSHGGGGGHGHIHGAGGCHGHSHGHGGHGHSHGGGHGHSHGPGMQCFGHHDEEEDIYEQFQESSNYIVSNKFEDKAKYAIEFDPVSGKLEIDSIAYQQYKNEHQMKMIMDLITRDLSEPYSIYTYRYFIHNWPYLCFLVSYF